MAWAGTDGSTPSAAAVPGMSWVRPRAPAGLPASGLKFDSWRMSPRSSAGSTPYLAAAASISAAYGVAAPAPAAPVAPAADVAVVALASVTDARRAAKSAEVADDEAADVVATGAGAAVGPAMSACSW